MPNSTSTSQKAIDLKKHIMITGNYVELPNFPYCIESLSEYKDLVMWLASIDRKWRSSCYAATRELIRLIDPINDNLHTFADKARQFPVEQSYHKCLVDRWANEVDQQIYAGYPQIATEKAMSLAWSIVEDYPEFAAQIAEWLCSLEGKQ